MDEKDWLILQAIYEERNITKAAERLYTSQPSLTYRLQQMEEDVGVKIVWRSKKGIKFTSEGEYLVKYAKNMLLELQKTKDYLLNMNNNVEGIIRLGVSSNFAHYKLPNILKSFLEHYPNVQFNVYTGWSSEIYQLLQNEDVHIGIIRGNYNWDDHKLLINEESICIISNRKIGVEDLPKLPRINYKTDPLLKQLISNWWNQRFTQPPMITMEVDKIQTCKEMVINGLGYGIIPSICLKPYDELHTINLTSKNEQVLLRKTWMIYRESELKFSVVDKFVDFLKNQSMV
jgi:DNA-binding transcriptional LysR family regulator